MFESAELGHKVSKSAFREAVAPLREALLEAQAKLVLDKKTPVLILISGEDGAGKRETIHVLYEWMDPRYLSTLAFDTPSDEERERPPMWRYWRSLPPKGRIGVFAGSWYSEPIRQRIEGEISQQDLDARAASINRFEAMLVNEGALILKFWIHLTKAEQRKRFEDLASNPLTAWRVTPWHWDRLKTYDKLHAVASHFLRMTDTAWAPWRVVEGTDERYRSLRVGQLVQAALAAHQAKADAAADPVGVQVPASVPLLPAVLAPGTQSRNVLSAMDLSLCLSDVVYERELALLQGRLSVLARTPEFLGRSLVLAFEGADAAGKGGVIRRISGALDTRQFQVVPVAAPTEEERAQPHLWRFWRNLPRKGQIRMFDRTWYGRVLVERIEGFCAPKDWNRAYGEINDFEQELNDAGVIVMKFWLQISQEEQLKRFGRRQEVGFKRFKITQEDWRNREKWNAYQEAICDMVERTSTPECPWLLVEANDKNYARIKILRAVCDTLERVLDVAPPKPSRTSKPPKPPKAAKSAKSGKTPSLSKISHGS
ncbi:polyphosphate:AMP phosphotransferase [Rhodoferax sp.]|jgi:polyphosphate:AMP phosphotransferase|uniref:polyphosphate:AMP phosphotransferase n=1 Tax=Rhodoferax sp. TaxID=50421 RepID=UPI003783162C